MRNTTKVLILVALIINIIGAGCEKDVEKAKQQMLKTLPTGNISAGEVKLGPMNLSIQLPVDVLATIPRTTRSKQWQAISRERIFNISVAFFPDTVKTLSPEKLVKRRTKQLLKEELPPDTILVEQLNRIRAASGYENLLDVEELIDGHVTSKRKFLIQAYLLKNGATLVVSADLKENAIGNADSLLSNLSNSIQLIK